MDVDKREEMKAGSRESMAKSTGPIVLAFNLIIATGVTIDDGQLVNRVHPLFLDH